MNQPVAEASAHAGPSGLIDTIQAGLNTTNRHLWLLLLPLVIDLVLWLGPQVTIGGSLLALTGQRDSILPTTVGLDWFARAPDAALAPQAGATPELADGLPASVRELQRANLLWLLAMPPMGIPSFRVWEPGAGVAIPLDSPVAVTAVSMAAILCGFALAVVYYGLLAQVVRAGRVSAATLASDFPVLLIRTVALVMLVLAAVFALGVPVGVIAAVQLAPSATLLLTGLIAVAGFWLFVHFFFAPDALFVSEVGPLNALTRSARIVRTFFWQSLVFVGIVLVITLGFSRILNEVADSLRTPGMVLAIVGHIYISTAVTVATMTYYRERFDRLQSVLSR